MYVSSWKKSVIPVCSRKLKKLLSPNALERNMFLTSEFWTPYPTRRFEGDTPPVDLYLISEKSSLKNQVQRTEFLTSKKQFQNWFLHATQAVKIQLEID